MPAATTVFVVSDLHLGGPEGFQMCSPDGVARLAEFLRWVPTQRNGEDDLQLVLAGDVIDLLAEPDALDAKERTWSAFVSDPALAFAKVESVLRRTTGVWDALRGLVGGGAALTIMVGNHDIELALPAVRAKLLERIAPRGGRVTFLHDNEGFTLGKLLVEHGNRYDAWNAVDHDGLRRVRSSLSRREPLDHARFSVQPGSELVAKVMNAIKSRYAFVDLLKPETGAVVPILAVLAPGIWTRAGRAIWEAARAGWRSREYDRDGRPAGELIGAESVSSAPSADTELVGTASPGPALDQDALELADELAKASGGGDAELVGALDFVEDVEVKLLLKAFRKREELDRLGFGIDREHDPYARNAQRLVESAGFQTVIFGHTHHAKHVQYRGGTYLNTGTWADLMRLPPEVYAGSEAAGVRALERFLDDVKNNRVDRYRRQVATFARIEVDPSGNVGSREVHFFDGAGKTPVVSQQGVLDRLAPPPAP